MEHFVATDGGVGHKLGKSTMIYWLPAPQIVLVQIMGHGEGAFVDPILALVESAIAQGVRLELFFEIESMPRYETAFRTRFTSYFERKRHDVESLSLVTGSKFALMGATVANLVLGGFIKMYPRRSEFDLAVDIALKQAGVSTLSSAVFRSAAAAGQVS